MNNYKIKNTNQWKNKYQRSGRNESFMLKMISMIHKLRNWATAIFTINDASRALTDLGENDPKIKINDIDDHNPIRFTQKCRVSDV